MRLIRQAARDLRAHPARSLLTAVSLFVAVISIVVVFTAGAIVRDVFVASAEQANGRATTIETRIEYGTLSAARLTGVLATIERRVGGSGTYALVDDVPGSVVGVDGTPHEQDLTLVAGHLDRIRRLPVIRGTWLPADDRIHPGGVVLNQSAATLLGDVGSRVAVRLGPAVPPYRQDVVGVIADGSPQPRVYLSMTSAVTYQPAVLAGKDQPDLFIHYPAESTASAADTARRLADELNVRPNGALPRRSDTIEGLLDNLRATQRAFLGTAGITLIVAMLGLVNIGLATVRERRRELTIRRALGATRGTVFGLVLLGSVLIGLLAAGVAVVVAYLGVVVIVPRLLDPASAIEAPAFPWSAGLAGLAAAMSAALLGGVAPAVAAARADVANVLRE
jgi:hypothetical protein